jgi:hypothetical protein
MVGGMKVKQNENVERKLQGTVVDTVERGGMFGEKALGTK